QTPVPARGQARGPRRPWRAAGSTFEILRVVRLRVCFAVPSLLPLEGSRTAAAPILNSAIERNFSPPRPGCRPPGGQFGACSGGTSRENCPWGRDDGRR